MKKFHATMITLTLILLTQSLFAQRPGPTLPKAATWFTITYPTQDNKAMVATASNGVVLESADDESAYWKLIPMPDKSYHIFNKKTGKFLTVSSSNVLQKLSLTTKPDANSSWWITQGTGMASKYVFIRNKTTKLFPVKDPDGTNAVVQSTGDMGSRGKFFSIRLTDKGPAN